MRSTTEIIAGIVMMLLGATGTAQDKKSANLAVNGTFEEGLKGWCGQMQKDAKSVKINSMPRLSCQRDCDTR